MASGFGFKGGPTRCFAFWQEVMGCYVLNTTGDDAKGAEKCIKPLEDYNECLFHVKEAKRVNDITVAYRKWEAANPNAEKKSIKELKSLGLIEASLEEMNMKKVPFLPIVKYN